MHRTGHLPCGSFWENPQNGPHNFRRAAHCANVSRAFILIEKKVFFKKGGGKGVLMENFWQMLREKRPELTRSGRLVADYLLQNPQGAQNLSISQLAQVCQVAEATIFRFCRALGFEGYHEMKIAIAQANAMVSPLPTRLEPGADTATLYRYASESVVEMLSAMRGVLELAAVDQAAALLKNARQVYCLGQGSGQILAKDIWSRFASLSNKFRTAGDTHMQAVAASLMGPEDTVLFVSYSGLVRDTLETLRLARGSGARVILLTYCPDTPANALADVVLRCGGGENPLDMLGMPAKIAVLFAANVLVLRYMMDNPEQVERARHRTGRALGEKSL